MVLAVVAALSAILVPMVTGYVQDSRRQRSLGDLRAIGDAMDAVHRDLGDFPIFRDGGDLTLDASSTYAVLEGVGETPTLNSSWSDNYNNGNQVVGPLSGQLIENGPSYSTQGRFAWRGPYLDDLAPDPWGRAYLINSENLMPNQDEAGYVLSAGPNGEVETDFEIGRTSGSVTPGGDDLLVRIR